MRRCKNKMSTSEDSDDELGLSSDENHNNFLTPRKRRYTRKLYRHSVNYHRKNTSPLTFTETRRVERSLGLPNFEPEVGDIKESCDERSKESGAESSSISIEHEETSQSSISQSTSDLSLDELEELEELPHPSNNLPIYDGSSHTELSSYVAVMLYVMKYSITKDGFTDLLKLISSFLPKGANFTTSVYKIKAFLKERTGQNNPRKHHLCNMCGCSVEGMGCVKPLCIQNNAKTIEFQNLEIENQLQELFKDDKFRETVSSRKQSNSNSLSDICDGEEYQRLQIYKTGSMDITLTLNTDGVTLFSSSRKGNLWPVYLAVNELPVRMRFSRKYIIPTLLYCHTEKPNMLAYLSPLMESLQKLHRDGIEVLTSAGYVTVRCHLLAVSLDLPARAIVLNMKQFNGKNGCSICMDEGQSPPNLPMLRYYPYTETCVLRSHQSMLRDARAAVEEGHTVHGINGASPLLILSYVDLPKTCVIDWMHCVLLGVVKTLLSLWLDPVNKAQQFYIGDKMDLLNRRLMNIKVPDYIARCQRSLDDYKHWKATECREWLFHYSVPVLQGILTPSYLVHYSLLVSAMFKLNEESIYLDSVEESSEMIIDFSRLFQTLYSERKQTMNIHMLRHLPRCVKLHGPLFHYSCFGFESMNSYLKSMIHGTRFINNQLSFAVGMTRCLPELVKKAKETGEQKVDTLLCHLSNQLASDETEIGDAAAVGKKQGHNLSKSEERQLRDLGLAEMVATKFHRWQTKRLGILYADEYKRMQSRNSSTVAYKTSFDGSFLFGCINYFLEINNNYYYAVVEEFLVDGDLLAFPAVLDHRLLAYSQKNLCPHIVKVRRNHRQKKIVPVQNIYKKCLLMEFEHTIYISYPPNMLEHS